MGTIAIVACCDTKFHEISFVRDLIRAAGHTALVIDMSTGTHLAMSGDISRDEVLRAGGFVPENVIGHYSKSDSIAAMTSSICTLLPKLCLEKRIDAVFGMGGMQNTLMCSAAFRLLPIGFPKLIVSTVASGFKYFDMVVGTKDITVVPSIVDFCGMNVISEPILTNAAASIIGMIQYGGKTINTDGHRIIGATLMGITNDTVVAAEDKLTADGYELLSFHSTGVGGQVMEQMIRDGHIVGNHSDTHPSFPSISRTQMVKEIAATENYLREHFGYCAKFFRFPAGEYSESALDVVRQMGYRSVFWSVAYNDWNVEQQQGADKAKKTVLDRLHPGAVILLHAVSRDNAEALGAIIDAARAEGYAFVPLTHYQPPAA